MAGAPQPQHRKRWAEEDYAVTDFLRRQVGAPATWSDVTAAPCAEPSPAWVRPLLPGPLRKSLAEDESRFVRSGWASSSSKVEEEEEVTPPKPAAVPPPPWADPFRALGCCAPRIQPCASSEAAVVSMPSSSSSQTKLTARKPRPADRDTAARAPRGSRGARKRLTPARHDVALSSSCSPPAGERGATDSCAALRQMEAAFLKMRADIVSAVGSSAAPLREVAVQAVLQPVLEGEEGEQVPVLAGAGLDEEGAVRALVEDLRREVQTLSQLPEQVARECKMQFLQAMQQHPILLRGGPVQTVTVQPRSLLALQKPAEEWTSTGSAA